MNNILSQKHYIDIAIKFDDFLKISDFVILTKFPIDLKMLDMFWNNFNKDCPIYLDDNLIRWLGYQGELRTMKGNFLKFVRNNDISIIVYNQLEYSKFFNKQINNGNIIDRYIDPKNINKKANNINHILIDVYDFKKLVLMLKTTNGDRLRNHFISMDYLLQTYLKYQCEYEKIHYEKEIEKIKKSVTNIRYTRLQQINELEKELEQRYKIGVIYFITDGNFVKIGYCYNLKNRLEELQVGSPLKLYVRRHYLSEYPYLEEQRLHEEYKEFHLRGEWFKL